MTITATGFYKGTLGTSATTMIAAVPSGQKAVINSISVCNRTASAATYSMTFGGVQVFNLSSVPANTTIIITGAFVIEATQTATGLASAINTIDVTLNGQLIA